MTLHARKRFGQHFLERAWADKVLHAVDPRATDTFVEIGPGRGALTDRLAAASAAVVAVEIDRDLAAALRAWARPNVTIIEGDFLAIAPERLRRALSTDVAGARSVRVAANLPYNVASPILFKLIELYREGLPFVDATVMLQREVAERLVAPPGTRAYGVLSVLIRHAADAERVLALPPGAFRPAPKVHSVVVRLRFHEDRPPTTNRARFVALTQAIFTRRRKTLANALGAFAPAGGCSIPDVLRRAGLDGRRRPETLDIAELVRMADAFNEGPAR